MKLDDPLFPSERNTTLLEVLYILGDGPFICGADGPISLNMLEDISNDLTENTEEILNKGDGRYLFNVKRVPAMYFPSGPLESPAYWEMDNIAFKPLS